MKTPEEYFKETVKLPDENVSGSGLSATEQAFLSRYVGEDVAAVVKSLPRVDPSVDDKLPGFGATKQPTATQARTSESVASRKAPAPAPAAAEEAVDFDEMIRKEKDLQLVGFKLDRQELALPINVIQEVIRHVEPTRLPTAPAFLDGIVNLRGRVTPLVNLRVLMGMAKSDLEDRFIVVCRHRGLQIGLAITAVSTMYRPGPDDIEWNVESNLGIQAQFLAGLMKTEHCLINILSIDRLVKRVVG